MADVVHVAENLLHKTNGILARMERDFKQLMPGRLMTIDDTGQIQQSPRLLEFDKLKNDQVAQIRQEIDEIKAITARLGQQDTPPKDNNASKHIAANQSLSVKQFLTPPSNYAINSPGKSQDEEGQTGAEAAKRVVKRKSKRAVRMDELRRRIDFLEKQIEALRQRDNKTKSKIVSMEGVDFDSSANPSGSPVKIIRFSKLGLNERGSAEGIPHLEIASLPSVSPVKRSAVQKTFTVRPEKPQNGRYLQTETERIVDEGFRTAREINDRLRHLKNDSVRRNRSKSRDVASQVSIRRKDKKNKYNQQVIEELEKKVESLVRDCRHCHHSTNVAFQHVDAPLSPQKPKLIAQKLPNVDIPGCLTRQQLPSVHIPPPETPPPVRTANATVTVLQHGRKNSLVSRSEEVDSIECLLREVLAMQETTDLRAREDIGLQTSISRHSSGNNLATIDDKIDLLSKKFQERMENKMQSEKVLGDAFNDLLNQVSESKEKCQRYSLRRRFRDNLKEERILVKPKQTAFPLPHSSVQSIKTSSKERRENVGLDDYESDFEVESLQLDEPKLLSNASFFQSNADGWSVATENLDKRQKVTSPGGLLSNTNDKEGSLGSAQKVKSAKVAEPLRRGDSSPPSPIVLPSDRSLIEQHMKKLGLSPRRSVRGHERHKKQPHRQKDCTDLVPMTGSDAEKVTKHGPTEATLYIRSNGQFIPVDPLKTPRVNIIVPEIVVKMSEKSSAPPCSTVEQVVQTDEGFGTLTSGETTSVVDKINSHFERTQALLERLENRSLTFQRRRRRQKTLLDSLHIREDSGSASSSGSCLRFTGSEPSAGEVQLRPDIKFTANQHSLGRKESQPWARIESQCLNSKSEGEDDGNKSRSIGESSSWSSWGGEQATGTATPTSAQSDVLAAYQQMYPQIDPSQLTSQQLEQWQQWQQQYQAWQQQYGSKYEESLRAMSGPSASPALPSGPAPVPPPLPSQPPPPMAQAPPIPLPQQRPPLPPEEIKPPPPAKEKAVEKEELSEAEKNFDIQFKQWEEQFEAWKEQNAEHPDKVQYREYEKKWESWREQLVQRREQMRKKRIAAKMEAAPPLPDAKPPSAPPPEPPPPVNPYNDQPLQFKTQPAHFAKQSNSPKPLTKDLPVFNDNDAAIKRASSPQQPLLNFEKAGDNSNSNTPLFVLAGNKPIETKQNNMKKGRTKPRRDSGDNDSMDRSNSSPGPNNRFGPNRGRDFGPNCDSRDRNNSSPGPNNRFGPNNGPDFGPNNGPDFGQNMSENFGMGGNLGPNMGPGGNFGPNMMPGGNFGPNMMPGGNFSPNMMPGGNFGPNMMPGGNFGPNMMPGGNFGPNMMPGGNFGSNMMPGGNFGPNMMPGGNFGPNMMPGGNFGPNMMTGVNFGPNMMPGGNFGPNMMPGGNFGPNMMPGGNFGPNMMPGGNFGPNMMPDGGFGPDMGPGGNFGPGDNFMRNDRPGGNRRGSRSNSPGSDRGNESIRSFSGPAGPLRPNSPFNDGRSFGPDRFSSNSPKDDRPGIGSIMAPRDLPGGPEFIGRGGPNNDSRRSPVFFGSGENDRRGPVVFGPDGLRDNNRRGPEFFNADGPRDMPLSGINRPDGPDRFGGRSPDGRSLSPSSFNRPRGYHEGRFDGDYGGRPGDVDFRASRPMDRALPGVMDRNFPSLMDKGLPGPMDRGLRGLMDRGVPGIPDRGLPGLMDMDLETTRGSFDKRWEKYEKDDYYEDPFEEDEDEKENGARDKKLDPGEEKMRGLRDMDSRGQPNSGGLGGRFPNNRDFRDPFRGPSEGFEDDNRGGGRSIPNDPFHGEFRGRHDGDFSEDVRFDCDDRSFRGPGERPFRGSGDGQFRGFLGRGGSLSPRGGQFRGPGDSLSPRGGTFRGSNDSFPPREERFHGSSGPLRDSFPLHGDHRGEEGFNEFRGRPDEGPRMLRGPNDNEFLRQPDFGIGDGRLPFLGPDDSHSHRGDGHGRRETFPQGRDPFPQRGHPRGGHSDFSRDDFGPPANQNQLSGFVGSILAKLGVSNLPPSLGNATPSPSNVPQPEVNKVPAPPIMEPTASNISPSTVHKGPISEEKQPSAPDPITMTEDRSKIAPRMIDPPQQMVPNWEPKVIDHGNKSRLENELKFQVKDYGHGADRQRMFDYAHGQKLNAGPSVKKFDYGHGSQDSAPKTFEYGHGGQVPAPKAFDYGHGGRDVAPKSFDYGHGGKDVAPKSFDYGHEGKDVAPKSFDYGHGGKEVAPKSFDYGHGGKDDAPKSFDYGHGGKDVAPKSFDYGHGGKDDAPKSFDYGHGGKDVAPKSFDYGHGGKDVAPKSFDYGHGGQDIASKTFDYGHGGQDAGPKTFDYGHGGQDKEPKTFDYGHNDRARKSFDYGRGDADATHKTFDYGHGPKTFDYGLGGGQKGRTDRDVDSETFDYAHREIIEYDYGDKGQQKTVDYQHERNRSPSSKERDHRPWMREKAETVGDRWQNQDRSKSPSQGQRSNQGDHRERDHNRERNKERDRDLNRERERDRDVNRERERHDRGGRLDRDSDRRDIRERGGRERDRSPLRSRRSRSPRRPNRRDEARDDNKNNDEAKVIFIDEEKPESEVTNVLVEDLLCAPRRTTRPSKIVVILRGLPGSGKSYVARLVKEKEVEQGGPAPRILSIDDYFMTDVEELVKDEQTGQKVKTRVMKYEYDKDMEIPYQAALVKAFKKTISDGFFTFVIVDSVNHLVKDMDDMWSFAKKSGFQVYIAEMDNDVSVCKKRTSKDITVQASKWQPTPRHYLRLDVRSLLQAEAIDEVEMEDVQEDSQEAVVSTETKAEEEDEPAVSTFLKSKWDDLENPDQKLDRLDGLKKRKPAESMEEYLNLDEFANVTSSSDPGKKRVRWADIEERREQDKMRAIGFVVGQTDWKRMMDPKSGESALIRTKYI